MAKMDWNKLVSTQRFGQKDSSSTQDEIKLRSEFQRDYDRLIFSSPFRRLQNKTQVFPLPGSTFVHNRLTHSLEVASVGRTMGTIIGQKLIEKFNLKSALFWELGTAVAAACLAHDMGNPPFGHSGEKAIIKYFKDHEALLKNKMNEKEWQDLIKFEGNANAFRLLTHQFKGRREGGFVLTYTTLATIIKYPCESIAGFTKESIHTKKSGFFFAERDSYLEIADALGITYSNEENIKGFRHPLVYLLEAADDICYNLIDIEDAHRLNIISTNDAIEFFRAFFQNDKIKQDKIDTILKTVTDANEQIAYLRATVIGKLIIECTNLFWEHSEKILESELNSDLTSMLEGDSKVAMDAIKTYSAEHIYNHPSVVRIELTGYNVLGGLLEEMIPAILDENRSHYSNKISRLIPLQFRSDEAASPYEKALSVVDYISGMTDNYAVELYRQLKGMSIQQIV